MAARCVDVALAVELLLLAVVAGLMVRDATAQRGRSLAQ